MTLKPTSFDEMGAILTGSDESGSLLTQELPRAAADNAALRYDLRILQALRKILRGVELYSKHVSATSQITLPQLLCLLTVVNEGSTTAGAISRQVHLSASTVVGILDRLEEKGLVTRERDRRDRRVVHVGATSTGHELAARAPSPLQQHLADGVSALPELEQATIALALERIVDLMERGVGAVHLDGHENPATGGGGHL